MPIQEFNATSEYSVKPALPHGLAHKPVYAMPYWHFDGSSGKNDAKYLSVGVSQWSNNDLSLKIMRHGNQWSPQSEELPLHRVIDSTVFLAKVLLDADNDRVEIERNLFSNQQKGFLIQKEVIEPEEQKRFDAYMHTHEEHLKDRLNKLHQLLCNLKTQGKF